MKRSLLALAFFMIATSAMADDGVPPAFFICLMIFLFVAAILYVVIQSWNNSPKTYSKAESDSLRSQAEDSLERSKEEGIGTLTDVAIPLRNGETAFLSEGTALFELETSYWISGGGSNNSGGWAIPTEDMAKADSGTLVLTDQRIAFAGENRTRNFEIADLLEVKVQGNCIVIGGAQGGKNSLFSVKNPYLWQNRIQGLMRGDKPGPKGKSGSSVPEGGFKRKVHGTPDMKPLDPID
jgi:hypothetical protein